MTEYHNAAATAVKRELATYGYTVTDDLAWLVARAALTAAQPESALRAALTRIADWAYVQPSPFGQRIAKEASDALNSPAVSPPVNPPEDER